MRKSAAHVSTEIRAQQEIPTEYRPTLETAIAKVNFRLAVVFGREAATASTGHVRYKVRTAHALRASLPTVPGD